MRPRNPLERSRDRNNLAGRPRGSDPPRQGSRTAAAEEFRVPVRVMRAAMRRRILVTGGAGVIGSAVVREIIGSTPHQVMVVDKLTYAGNLDNLEPVADDQRFGFAKADIADAAKMRDIVRTFRPDAIMHLAAESHVDRSIDG